MVEMDPRWDGLRFGRAAAPDFIVGLIGEHVGRHTMNIGGEGLPHFYRELPLVEKNGLVGGILGEKKLNMGN